MLLVFVYGIPWKWCIFLAQGISGELKLLQIYVGNRELTSQQLILSQDVTKLILGTYASIEIG